MRILVTGAAGFVGRRLVPHLTEKGYVIRALVHRRPTSPLFGRAAVEVAIGDIKNPEDIGRALEGMEAVVNLAAILREGPQTFEAVNVRGPRILVDACATLGVQRFVHMSTLGGSPESPSAFQRSRWQGEEAVRAGPLLWTIVRASLILGPGSGFSRRMRRGLQARGPLPVLGKGRNLVQPVHVQDVVDLLGLCLEDGSTVRKVLEVGGPQRVTLEDLTLAFARAGGRKGKVRHIPSAIALLVSGILQFLSRNPIITPDEVRMAVEDNYCDNGPLEALGFSPKRDLAEQVSDSLAP